MPTEKVREPRAPSAPKYQPGTTLKKPKAFVYCGTSDAKRNVGASPTAPRRWTRKPRVTSSDVAAWLLFFLITAAVLLAFCILVTIAWPA